MNFLEIDRKYFEEKAAENNEFGVLLKGLRNDLGVSAQQLARESNYSVPYVYDIEGKRKSPSTKAVSQISNGLAYFAHLVSEMDKKELTKNYRKILKESLKPSNDVHQRFEKTKNNRNIDIEEKLISNFRLLSEEKQAALIQISKLIID